MFLSEAMAQSVSEETWEQEVAETKSGYSNE